MCVGVGVGVGGWVCILDCFVCVRMSMCTYVCTYEQLNFFGPCVLMCRVPSCRLICMIF